MRSRRFNRSTSSRTPITWSAWSDSVGFPPDDGSPGGARAAAPACHPHGTGVLDRLAVFSRHVGARVASRGRRVRAAAFGGAVYSPPQPRERDRSHRGFGGVALSSYLSGGTRTRPLPADLCAV